jgi:hypothetical protein
MSPVLLSVVAPSSEPIRRKEFPVCAVTWHNDRQSSAECDNFSLFIAVKWGAKGNSSLYVRPQFMGIPNEPINFHWRASKWMLLYEGLNFDLILVYTFSTELLMDHARYSYSRSSRSVP